MKKARILHVSIILLFVFAAASGFFFLSAYNEAQEEIKEYAKIQEGYTSIQSMVVQNDENSDVETTLKMVEHPYVVADFDSLRKTNADTVGWLAIPDTVISYPIVQTDNNEKYLHKSFNGEHSKVGAIFMDANNNASPLDQNIIVYGHNMGSGRTDMFGTLLSYDDKSYYDTHEWIQFDTLYRRYGWWQIFSVIHLNIDAAEFDYLKQNFNDAAEFEAWIAQAKALSAYDTGVAIPDDAHILTLSTCNRAQYGISGRQIILAVNTSGQIVPK